MAFWTFREHLSMAGRMRRSYYELLRDQLDQFMLRYALVDSYEAFRKRKEPYPFVERREMKPRARIPSHEYEAQNAFLVIFVEDTIPAIHKKYIRFFDVNKTTKTNLTNSKVLSVGSDYDRSQKALDNVQFFDFMGDLLPVDYALLIQRDPASHTRDRFQLSHYHVRIDWPIAEAAEEMARNLRYISKDLYEKGDKYAEDLQKKFFEYYAQPVMVGGRRTAAIVASQYLRRLPCISTIYAGSSESRALIRLSERGTSKSTLVALTDDESKSIAADHFMNITTFRKNYMVAKEGKLGVYMLEVHYTHTSHAKPPEDGKLREVNPDPYWVTITRQQILPKPGVWRYQPLGVNLIYG